MDKEPSHSFEGMNSHLSIFPEISSEVGLALKKITQLAGRTLPTCGIITGSHRRPLDCRSRFRLFAANILSLV